MTITATDAGQIRDIITGIDADLASIRKILAPYLVEPVPVIDPREPRGAFIIDDVIVLPGERFAEVKVRLAAPLLRQVEINFGTINGSAIGGTGTRSQFEPVKQRLRFLPGEIEKIVIVPIKQDLGARTFRVAVTHTYNYPALADVTGIVREAATRNVRTRALQPLFTPVDGRAGRTLIWQDDFLGALKWDTKAGVHQAGNKELALYVDKDSHPGFDPHPVELVDGVERRKLRMIRRDVTLVKTGGATTTLPYRAPMLDSTGTGYECRDGDHIELDVAVAKGTTGVPAFWLMSPSGTPYAEEDIFEFNLTGSYGAMACSVHYPDAAGEIVPENCVVPWWADGLMHTYGFTRNPDWCITFIDGVEIHRRRNLFPGRALRVKINNTCGGIGPDPKWAPEQTEDMILGAFRAYRAA